MGWWCYYFFAKLLLYFAGFIGFHFWANLGFAAFTLVPARRRWQQVLKQLVAVPAGIALLYYDSWLPPIRRAFEQAQDLKSFTFAYMMELLGRFVNVWVIGGIVLLCTMFWLLSFRLRLSTLAVCGILSVPVVAALPRMSLQAPRPAVAVKDFAPGESPAPGVPAVGLPAVPATDVELNNALAEFYRNEAKRQVTFTAPTGAPFDILILQVCSLAWDDLVYAHMENVPLLSHFDILFSNFNSAASYSGPAAIRLLRGACGQQKHGEIRQPTAANCFAFSDLQQVGFKPNFLMNHDGVVGYFLYDVRTYGGLQAPYLDVKSEPVAQRSFEQDAPIYDDFAVLSKWWQNRVADPAERVALYYNTISLHDGNHFPDQLNANSRETWPLRAEKLTGDLDKFLSKLEASGRRAVVVIVPEHGVWLRGDRLQIPGLREIPSVYTTKVPVGIKLVGRKDPLSGGVVNVPQLISYTGLYDLISRFLANSPFEPNAPALTDYLRDLPRTDWVSENEGNVIMRAGNRYMMRTPDMTWTEYPPTGP